MTAKTLSVFLSFFVFFFIIELIRREKLTFKYAVAWLMISLLAIIFSVYDNLLYVVSVFLGFELPSNFVFFTILGCLVFVSLIMTIFLCQQNNRNDKIAQELSIIKYEIEALKKDKDKKD